MLVLLFLLAIFYGLYLLSKECLKIPMHVTKHYSYYDHGENMSRKSEENKHTLKVTFMNPAYAALGLYKVILKGSEDIQDITYTVDFDVTKHAATFEFPGNNERCEQVFSVMGEQQETLGGISLNEWSCGQNNGNCQPHVSFFMSDQPFSVRLLEPKFSLF